MTNCDSLFTKMNNKTIVLEQLNPQKYYKFQGPNPFPFGRHKCMVSMLWKMRNTNEGWSFFYQFFEINLQLVILFIFLKLGTDFFSSRFSYFLISGYSKLLLLPFFLVSYTPAITGFLCCLLCVCGHIHMFSVLDNSDIFLSLLIGEIYI